eukprot:1547412-Pleurochrysis_carterae.AAC.1
MDSAHGKDPALARLNNFVGLQPADYPVFSSLHYSQRVPAPAPGSNAIKRFANIVTRKGRGKGSAGRRAPGLPENFALLFISAVWTQNCPG